MALQKDPANKQFYENLSHWVLTYAHRSFFRVESGNVSQFLGKGDDRRTAVKGFSDTGRGGSEAEEMPDTKKFFLLLN